MNQMEFISKLEILKDKVLEDPELLFDALGFEMFDRGDYYNGPCPIHQGDNPSGFSFKKDTGLFKCWTNHCEHYKGPDVIALTQCIKECSFKDAIKFLESICAVEYNSATAEAVRNKKFIRKINREVNDTREKFPEEILKRLKLTLDVENYFGRRNFLRETLTYFEVGHATTPNTFFAGRAVFPVRDQDGALVAFTGRDITGTVSRDRPKWIHRGQMHEYLYGFHGARSHIEETQEVIIVEGPLGVLRLWEAGYKNTVCIFGTSLSDRQRRLLLESGAFRAKIALDNDEAGNNGASKMINGYTLKGKKNNGGYLGQFFYCEKIDLGNFTDLDEMTVEQVRKVMNA